MPSDGYYGAERSGQRRAVTIRDEVRYESVLDVLTDNDQYLEGNPAPYAAEVVNGVVVRVYIPSDCSGCHAEGSVYDDSLRAYCPSCAHTSSGPVRNLLELSLAYGVGVVPVEYDLWLPAQTRLSVEKRDRQLKKAAPDLEALADPARRDAWIAAHSGEPREVIGILTVMVATGSVLDEHREVAGMLARMYKEHLKQLVLYAETMPSMAPIAGPLQTLAWLAEN